MNSNDILGGIIVAGFVVFILLAVMRECAHLAKLDGSDWMRNALAMCAAFILSFYVFSSIAAICYLLKDAFQ